MYLGTINGYSRALIFKKPVTAFRAKKGGVFIDVECATKNSEARCDIAPTATTIVLTSGGVSQLICKNILFCFHTLSCDTRS
jgi:hypothetical protein